MVVNSIYITLFTASETVLANQRPYSACHSGIRCDNKDFYHFLRTYIQYCMACDKTTNYSTWQSFPSFIENEWPFSGISSHADNCRDKICLPIRLMTPFSWVMYWTHELAGKKLIQGQLLPTIYQTWLFPEQ